jgi:hypothetical protein
MHFVETVQENELYTVEIKLGCSVAPDCFVAKRASPWKL